MTDVALALDVLVPGAAYGGSLTANTKAAYDSIRWEDDRPKPSWTDVQAVVIPEPVDPQDAFATAIEQAVAGEPAGSTVRKLADALLGKGDRVAAAQARGKSDR